MSDLKELMIDFNERLKHEVIPQLFISLKNEKNQFMAQRKHNLVNEDGLSFISKYNILMSQISLKDATDSDFLKGMASLAVTNFT